MRLIFSSPLINEHISQNVKDINSINKNHVWKVWVEGFTAADPTENHGQVTWQDALFLSSCPLVAGGR